MKKQKYFTQTILGDTVLFGKRYFWMQDVDGTIYLAKAKKKEGLSVDGTTGEKSFFTQGYVPEFL